MARTPLAQHLLRLCSLALDSDPQPLGAPAADRRAHAFSRREFLGRAGKIGLGALAGGALLEGKAFAAKTSLDFPIAIVGAGLAGLTCAYRLKRHGIRATLYEAAGDLGGRCQTRRNAFADHQIAERGGEFIDSGHADIRRLAAALGLHFDNVKAAEKPGSEPFYLFGGSRYSAAQALADFRSILPKLKSDLRAADYPTLYHQHTPRGLEIDQMSINDWIEESVPGGLASTFGQLLNVAYTIEYGGECAQQSALNLLYLLGYSHQGRLELFGASDERFHLHGGNDRLVKHLAAELPGQIETGQALTAIAREGGGRYRLTFADATTVTANRVVLALPFSILRDRVDYSQAGFSPLKRTAIEQLGMGTNTKLHVQFTDRLWRKQGGNGDSYSDTGCQNTWDASRAQPGHAGLMVNFTGGVIGASFDQGSPESRAARFLGQIEGMYPGATARWNGKATLEYWTGNPWTLGSYSYWKVTLRS